MALCFRRPSVLRYDSWITACLDVLQSAASSSQSDRQLVAWVRLQSIAEEGSIAIGAYDDAAITISDMRTQNILSGCVRQVSSWRRSILKEDMNRIHSRAAPEILLSLIHS
jgi:hypothetical protein